ncbi:MAG TPA: TIGR03621 family F420-dependent LLM class oxidoreductase [Acidimicrobiales bacterium]|nr:TIGR03621 family F420-dependent LLM class oxidoreductase [Acidimicrobiales bacterium]
MTAAAPDRAPRPLRTGVVAMSPPASPAEWHDRVRRIDEHGHDVLLTADHLGNVPPLPPLVAAAAVSDRLRFGTQVLNNGFWNPVLLARDAAAVDVLTGGRLELGLGAGHAAVEFAAAGLPYPRPGARVDQLAEAVPLVRRLLAGERVDAGGAYRLDGAELGFAAAQQPVPLMVGGNGDRVLRLAAEHADIVGLVGFTAGTGRVHTDLSHFTWDGLADRVDHVRRHAGERFARLELSVLVQAVVVTGDRRRAAVDFSQGLIDDVGPLLDSPFLLLGTEAELTGQLRRLRDEAGVTYVTTFERSSEPLALAAAPLR